MRQMITLMLIAIGTDLSGHAEQNAETRNSTTGGTGVASGYVEGSLSSRFLKARFYLPDPEKGYYRGTRFDWSGLVSRVDYGTHTFFCEFKEQHDPLNHDDVCGTAEEFGITSPSSYDRARAGEPFMKIGIGVLERADGTDYKFWLRYKIQKPGEWRILREPDKIQFTQNLTGPNGWGYEYTKTIEASQDAPVLRIRRRLRNTGTETIDTDHYGHNFLRIDNVPAGTNYILEFPFEPRLGEDSKTQDCVELKSRSLVFTKAVPPGQAIWVRLEGFGKLEDNEIKIVNHSTGATMTISTDQPLTRLVLYSSGGVLCPEAFIKLAIPPGQTHEWTTTYRFAAGAP
jgi:hypothetical protein